MLHVEFRFEIGSAIDYLVNTFVIESDPTAASHICIYIYIYIIH